MSGGTGGRIVRDGEERATVELPHRKCHIGGTRIDGSEEQMFQRFFQMQRAGNDRRHGLQQDVNLNATLLRVDSDLATDAASEFGQIDRSALRRLREEPADDERIQSSLRFLGAIQLAQESFRCLFGDARATKRDRQRKQRGSEKEEVGRDHAI